LDQDGLDELVAGIGRALDELEVRP